MENISKIAEHISGGCNTLQRMGLELEHFVCNRNYELISYGEVAECLEKMASLLKGERYTEAGNIFGIITDEYTITLEPGCQLEISISPKADAEEIRNIYAGFRAVCDRVLEEKGYFLLERGVFPLIENGSMSIDDMPLIPKERYRLMNQYFSHSGTFGKYMMRATASTQVSIDFSSEADALKKMRIFEKLAPILALLTENKSGIGTKDQWNKHILRNQIWYDVDKARCGYFENSINENYSFAEYAEHVYTNPCILFQKGEEVTDLQNKSAKDYFGENEVEAIDHILSMFFPTVRLKKYVEIRIADSMPIEKAIGYASLVKVIAYNENVLDTLDKWLINVKNVEALYQAEEEISKNGYQAVVYGKPVQEWLSELFSLVLGAASEEDKREIKKLITLPMINYQYKSQIFGNEAAHVESAENIKSYLMNSTAKYHNRVVRTLYLPKMFTPAETGIFDASINILYGIFNKVIREYEINPEYRALFGFSDELNQLILRENRLKCNVPISRIDIFYDEETKDFKFCEFNTDGTSAMNEDRELNKAFSASLAYKEFEKSYELSSYELFDTWVSEVIQLYHEYKKDETKVPCVAIVDFMENATTNEFIIFKERFEARGCKAEVCDIRELKWDGTALITPEGNRVDVIYRRAVTSDIVAHFDEVDDFIAAVKAEAVCLLGDFRTQIVHNKLLFKILHLDETMKLLTKEEQVFVKAHVPMTVSLDSTFVKEKEEVLKNVYEHKDNWIIKPEDSYGSKGVYAGVEYEDKEEWKRLVDSCIDKHYILQEFMNPYRLSNIDLLSEEKKWITTSNLTGLFVYNEKFSGIYSRISYDKMISTQYNEMSLPTVIVKGR